MCVVFHHFGTLKADGSVAQSGSLGAAGNNSNMFGHKDQSPSIEILQRWFMDLGIL
jgi:hypothetical protein